MNSYSLACQKLTRTCVHPLFRRKVWMSWIGWGSLCSKNEASYLNVKLRGPSRGSGLWARVVGSSQRGKRFRRKGQACKFSAAHSIQPLELRAFILGNNVGFISCKNGASKPGLLCSESCTGRDHLSALIESPGCRTGSSSSPVGRANTHVWRTMWDLSRDYVRNRINWHLQKVE